MQQILHILAGHAKCIHLIGSVQSTSLEKFSHKKRKENPPKDKQFTTGRLEEG
jgi:hypothetical protein